MHSLEAGHLVPLGPQHILYATDKTAKLIANISDRFGDSFTVDLTMNTIRDV